MKKFLLALLLGLNLTMPLFSQEESTTKPSPKDDGEIKTLFKKSNHKAKIGYYIGPEGAYTQFKGRDVFLGGLGLGVIVNHFFSVGLEGYGIVNSNYLWYDNVDATNKRGAYLYGGYGGLKFEFRLWAKSPVHVNFPLLIGGGGLTYNTTAYHNHDYNNNNNNGTTLDWDSFFVVEPGVMLELNLLKFMRLGAGISYRYSPDVDLMNTPGGLINNFNAKVSLRFGKF
jgi:hypothetical protein